MPAVGDSVVDLARTPAVRSALEWFRKERAWINEQHLKVCRVAAPTFLAEKRAAYLEERFRELGRHDRILAILVVCVINHRT